jgi:allantoicase
MMTVQIDPVQMVPDGFGFHIKASDYTWITLVFETKNEAEEAHAHAAKAVAHARSMKFVTK